MSDYVLETSVRDKCANIWLEMSDVRNKYIIGAVYSHPNGCMAEFQNKLDKTLSIISIQKSPCIIAGDLNINLVKCSVAVKTADF